MRGAGEVALDVAVRERLLVDDVGAEVLVQQRRPGRGRRDRVHERLEQLVVDLDELERVLGQVARLGDGDRDRLAGVADLVDRDRVLDDLLGAEARQRVDRARPARRR